jgi:hypothetical protein
MLAEKRAFLNQSSLIVSEMSKGRSMGKMIRIVSSNMAEIHIKQANLSIPLNLLGASFS